MLAARRASSLHLKPHFQLDVPPPPPPPPPYSSRMQGSLVRCIALCLLLCIGVANLN